MLQSLNRVINEVIEEAFAHYPLLSEEAQNEVRGKSAEFKVYLLAAMLEKEHNRANLMKEKFEYADARLNECLDVAKKSMALTDEAIEKSLQHIKESDKRASQKWSEKVQQQSLQIAELQGELKAYREQVNVTNVTLDVSAIVDRNKFIFATGNPCEEETQPDNANIQDAIIVDEGFMNTKVYSEEAIRKEINEIIDKTSVKCDIWKKFYLLQQKGWINIDQYKSDEERAAILNAFQTKMRFTSDDVQRGRKRYKYMK